jgi:hypothetical protein
MSRTTGSSPARPGTNAHADSASSSTASSFTNNNGDSVRANNNNNNNNNNGHPDNAVNGYGAPGMYGRPGMSPVKQNVEPVKQLPEERPSHTITRLPPGEIHSFNSSYSNSYVQDRGIGRTDTGM